MPKIHKEPYKNRLQILAHLKMSGPMSTSELCKIFKEFHKSRIDSYLRFLLETGNIKRYKRYYDRKVIYEFIQF